MSFFDPQVAAVLNMWGTQNVSLIIRYATSFSSTLQLLSHRMSCTTSIYHSLAGQYSCYDSNPAANILGMQLRTWEDAVLAMCKALDDLEIADRSLKKD